MRPAPALKTATRQKNSLPGINPQPSSYPVQVPHDFVVNGRTLPAGAYQISRGSNLSLGMLLIRSDDGKSVLFFMPSTVEGSVSQMPHLSFVRIVDQYVLSGVQTSNTAYTAFASEQKSGNDVQPASAMSSGN